MQKDLGSSQNPSDLFVSLMGGAPVASGVRVSDTTAMRVSAVYSCVRVIAEDGAKLKPQVWREKPDGSREPATDHPLHAILRRPNRHMTPVSLLLAMFSAWGFRGNAIAVILRDRFGNATGLWPVHPGSVTIYEAMDGRLFYAISRRTTLENAMLRNVPPMVPDYDVLHVRGMTFDGIVGLSPLAQLREAIGIAIAGEELSGKLMANGAQPGGVLKHPKALTKDVADRLRDSWRGRYAGSGNAGTTVILEEGMEFQALGMTSVDAQFLEQRKLTIEEIARGFRVPLHMIGMLDRMTNNNVEALTRTYYDQTLMPMLEAFEAEFERAFNLPDGVYVEFDVRRLLRADFKTRQEGNRTMFQSGALMPNEWRIDEGYNPSPAGNVFARPLNTAYVDQQGAVVSITPPGGKSPTEPGAAPNPEEPK
ncbi:phage portal protein [Azospirillum sp. B2RO_4]|uniref:phage portal protein n=1 Tax=Azospirillum sp. B2RO_4 TaxID=3027796 RepID=UPI003DA85718